MTASFSILYHYIMLPLFAAEYRKMVEKLYRPPQYGLERRRRTIDCAGQVRCLREDKKGGSNDEFESFMAALYNKIRVSALSKA